MGMQGKFPYPPMARYGRIRAIRSYAYGPGYVTIFMIYDLSLFDIICNLWLAYTSICTHPSCCHIPSKRPNPGVHKKEKKRKYEYI